LTNAAIQYNKIKLHAIATVVYRETRSITAVYRETRFLLVGL